MVVAMIGVIALLTFFLAVFLLALSFSTVNKTRAIRNKYSVLKGKIVYTDLDKPAEALFSHRLGLVGKPDYIVQVKGKHVPVEIKSSHSDSPFHNHVLQLGAYCLLTEEVYGAKVPFGILVYGNGQQFKIPFTSGISQEVLAVMEKIKSAAESRDIKRNHQVEARCRSCSFAQICEQKISRK
jgi:CRISPR-associated exonuclease Cas4